MIWFQRLWARLTGGRPDRTTVRGVHYVPVGPTSVFHDSEAARLAAEIGFMDELAEGETLEEFMRRRTIKINSSGKIIELLGYYVVPERSKPEDWTLEMARETSRHLGGMSAPRDRAEVERLLGESVVYFFALARASWPGTPSSSKSTLNLLALAARLMPETVTSAPGAPGQL